MAPTRQVSISNHTQFFDDILAAAGYHHQHHDHYELNDNISSNARHEPTEFQSNTDYMGLSTLPDSMTSYFNYKPSKPNTIQHHKENPSTSSLKVHVSDELHQVNNSRHLGSTKTTTTIIPTRKQIRNRKINQKHRANRYRYEVIRSVYESFNITKIKQILKSMNICYVNINMVRHRVFIGLKNQTIVDEVEKLLHDRMFTEQHYHRLYR